MSGGMLVISDLHAHAWPRFATIDRDGINSRLRDLLRVLTQIEMLIVEHRPSTVVLGGDLLHRRRHISFSTFGYLQERVQFMAQRCSVFAVVGNHDWETEQSHALLPLQYMPNVTVIDTPTWEVVPEIGPVFFVPHPPPTERHWHDVAEAMRGVRDGLFDHGWAFLHYHLDGRIVDHEYAVPSPLRLTDCDAFDKLLFGHIHGPSIEQDGRVHYVGAPLHFDFGDSGDRYAWIFHADRPAQRFPLTFPPFITSIYPKVPYPPEPAGFLRILNVPKDVVLDVASTASAMGWRGVLPLVETVPREALQALRRHLVVDEPTVRSYVERRYPDLTDDTRRQIVAACLTHLHDADTR